jgi:LmbE family N-acetylglucosaminyl deacetylase
MKTYQGIEIFNGVERAIFVAAHPDDIEGCAGGTLHKLVLEGVQVFSVNCTSGNIGTQNVEISRSRLASIRMAETDKAANILGIAEVFNLGYSDGELEPTLELRAELAKIYRYTRAEILFTFDPFWTDDVHPDHRASGQAALDAIIPSKMPLYRAEQLKEKEIGLGCIERAFLFYPERNSDVNIVIDISDVYNIKMDALLSHESQFPDKEQIRKWLEKWDGDTGLMINTSFAEGFKQKMVS